jgi:hypothetical protein
LAHVKWYRIVLPNGQAFRRTYTDKGRLQVEWPSEILQIALLQSVVSEVCSFPVDDLILDVTDLLWRNVLLSKEKFSHITLETLGENLCYTKVCIPLRGNLRDCLIRCVNNCLVQLILKIDSKVGPVLG